MATKRGRKSKDKATDSLLAAVRFVAIAQSDLGPLSATHSILGGGWIAASDGVLTAGCPIEDDLSACPHTRRLLAALERSGEGYAITQTDAARLSVKSGPLRATVPCISPEQVSVTGPDPKIAVLTPTFLAACQAIGHIASESGQSVDMISLLVQGPTLTATNRQVIAEYWHANDMPPYIVLPKTSVAALLKSGKTPTGFGFTHSRSFTFWFDDGSWLKTQLFEDKWPDVAKVFAKEQPGYANPIPDTLFKALKLIGDFSDCGRVEFKPGLLKTVNDDSDGAEHEVKGLIEGPKFAIKNLELLQPIAKTLSVPPANIGVAFFYGESLRGAISYYVL